MAINRTIIDYSSEVIKLWNDEKQAAYEAVGAAKDEALKFLSSERERIANMSREDAIKELIKANNIDSKINTINTIKDNGIFNLK